MHELKVESPWAEKDEKALSIRILKAWSYWSFGNTIASTDGTVKTRRASHLHECRHRNTKHRIVCNGHRVQF